MRHGVRVITIEDPVEYVFPSDYVWQYLIANANTDEEKNRAFAGKLKTALRQDPDIIMVGEIRGLEVAKEAVNAAITGHQVWTTLHVSDPFMIIQRLVAMGIDGFYLQDPKMLSSLIAQRLVKTLCPHRAIPAQEGHLVEQGVDREDWDNLKSWVTDDFRLDGVRLKGPGCGHCNGTGIKGRTVVSHVVPTDEDLLVTMVERGPMAARKSYLDRPDAEVPMEAHAVLKVLTGQVDPRFVAEMLGPIERRPENLRALTLEDI
jgi:type II secretory ATPase GspE/PulE/Tfp pilus assembly ATPase PilB-like protein